jgi:plasmid maintenance system antidote protein VapI
LRLGTCLGTSAELWLGLQQDYEKECLEDILESQGKLIKKEVQPLILKVASRLRK